MHIEPVRVGILSDYPEEPGQPSDLVDAVRLVFDEVVASGMVERPIELVQREVLGLPNGNYRAVQVAYDQLVDEGCVVIIGPYISENVVPLVAHVERRAEVAVITMAASEHALGEWAFALNVGSMPEEPMVLASVLRQDGRRRIAVAYEASLIGREYLGFADPAFAAEGLEIVATVAIPQVETDKRVAVDALRASQPDAFVHLGMGHGLWGFNEALRDAGWDPPRYTITPIQFSYRSEVWKQQLLGWIGLDIYDERNEVGQAFVDRFEARYGRRRDYYMTVYGRDVAIVVAHGLAGARPLTGGGVRDAIERIRRVPAASGAPGTRLRFGRFMHQGWMGTDYLISRRLLDDGTNVFYATASGDR